MRWRAVFIPALLCMLLAGCGGYPPRTDVLVYIQPTEDIVVENNGLRVSPGEDAVFYLKLTEGCSVSGVDYGGSYRTARRNGTVALTLEDISCPTRVRLQVTRRYAVVTYEPNGGTGEACTLSYDLTNHARPNTDTGKSLFYREGYTLTAWNTAADGSGERIGLGSRITPAPGGAVLYAQWEKWTDAAAFILAPREDGAVITDYHGTDAALVIPVRIDGRPVVGIAEGAFEGCSARQIIFPASLKWVADGAFRGCGAEVLLLFDNIERIGDAAFPDGSLKQLYINAYEAPYGYSYRKESCYADKVDMLILSRGEKRLVCYGGCAMWYNLDGAQMSMAFPDYKVINMGLNGTVSSAVQMQIIGAFLGEGDVFLHAPELSSRQQLFATLEMEENDVRLWCGIENNYDLFALVDLDGVSGVLDSFCHYLSSKDGKTSYQTVYEDDDGTTYLDRFGSVSFYRGVTEDTLTDIVRLHPSFFTPDGMAALEQYYDWYASLGVEVYVSYACVNQDALPEEQRGNAALIDRLVRDCIGAMDSATLISSLENYLYSNADFYDTNYHLLTDPMVRNTAKWVGDLKPYLAEVGT